MNKDEVIKKLYDGSDGHLQLSFDECCTLQKILINRGYAVMLTHGDIGDDYKIFWVYAGNLDNLEVADSSQVVFASVDWLNELIYNCQETEE